ncbi:MAG: nucleotide exchange factor GrpE [Pirellulales bacterium]
MTVQDTPEHEDADLEQAAQAEPATGSDVETQLRDSQDRLLRTQAELENFRKRSRREYEEAQRYREIDLLRDLLPVLDNAHRAIEAADKTSDIEALRSGFRMMAQQIEKLLGSHGCLTIETDGAPFDPTIHDAILQQPVPGAAAGTIVGTATKGYRLHDRVVRPAQVIVAKGE